MCGVFVCFVVVLSLACFLLILFTSFAGQGEPGGKGADGLPGARGERVSGLSASNS